MARIAPAGRAESCSSALRPPGDPGALPVVVSGLAGDGSTRSGPGESLKWPPESRKTSSIGCEGA